MTKVHPNTTSSPSPSLLNTEPTVLTVWNKSLLFNCRGFTVFDSKGNLVFRVENYASSSRAHILLMDAVGHPLLTIRRKRLSFGDHWMVYEGEETSNPRFSVKKARSLVQAKALVHVAACGGSQWGYVVEGSYGNRSCVVYDGRRRVAEIKRKEAVGNDVFRLEVEGPGDAAVAMALVVVLEQMFGSR